MTSVPEDQQDEINATEAFQDINEVVSNEDKNIILSQENSNTELDKTNQNPLEDNKNDENNTNLEATENTQTGEIYTDPIKEFEQNQKKREAERKAIPLKKPKTKINGNEKDNTQDSNDGEEIRGETVSPVVENKHVIKTWLSRGFASVSGILLIVFLYSIFFAGGKPKENKNTDNNGASEQVSAPTVQAQAATDANNLTLNKQQINTLKNANFGQINNQDEQQAMMDAAKAAEMRMSASSNVISNGSAASGGLSSGANKNNAVLGGDGTGDANTAFMAKVSQSTAPIANATKIKHLSTTLAQGNIIQATLDTRVASDLPGMVRAVTSRDIYSEDQSTLLIPRGSRLIGQYTNRIQQGQNRIFVVWQRLIRPDGIDIQIASPGTDTLGTAGLAADSIDHHFFQQFGSAILLSVIGAGAANIGTNTTDQYNSASAYRMAIAGSFNDEAKQSLQNTGVIPPTLYVDQGTKISVFIARDLDFYDALNSQNQDDSQSTGSLFQGNLNS